MGEVAMVDAIRLLEANGYLIRKPKKRPQGEKMTEHEKKRTPARVKPSEGMRRLAALFRKSDRWQWKVYHHERYRVIIEGKTKDEFYNELTELEAFYLWQKIRGKTESANWWKSDFETFLNNYDQQLDRAKQKLEEWGWPKSMQKKQESKISYMEPNWDWRSYLDIVYGINDIEWHGLPDYLQKEIYEQIENERKAG